MLLLSWLNPCTSLEMYIYLILYLHCNNTQQEDVDFVLQEMLGRSSSWMSLQRDLKEVPLFSFTSLYVKRKQLHSKQGKKVASGQWKLRNFELGSSLCAKENINMKEIFILLLDLYLAFCVQAIQGEIQIYIRFYPSIIAFLFISISFLLVLFFLFCSLSCFLLLFSKL